MGKRIISLTARLHRCPAKTRRAAPHCGFTEESDPARRTVLVARPNIQDLGRQERAMFMTPTSAGPLARERHREMLAHAEYQPLVQRLHAEAGTAQSGERPGHRLRRALRAAARLRALPGT